MPFLGEKPGLLRRTWPAAPGWSGGTFGKGAPVETPLSGVWRPMPATQLQRLEEGDRTRDPHVLVTRVQLQQVEQGTNLPADHISPDGGASWWEVEGERDGSENFTFKTPINHYTYHLLKVQEPDG